MSRKPESLFQDRVIRDLKRIPYSYFSKITQVSRRGDPDLYGCICGVFVALELKRSNKAKTDPLQWHVLQCIAQAGGVSILTYPENWADTLEFLKDLAQKTMEQHGIQDILANMPIITEGEGH